MLDYSWSALAALLNAITASPYGHTCIIPARQPYMYHSILCNSQPGDPA